MSVNISRNRSFFPGSTFVPIFLLVLSFSLVGCSGKKGSGTGSGAPPASSSTGSTKSLVRDPETMLSAVYEMCLPNRLGQKTTVNSATNRINEWLDSLRKREKISLDLTDDVRSKLGTHYTKAQMERIRSQRFDRRDIRHLRNQILMRNIVERIAKKEDILQDCTELFYYTIRNVALIDKKDTVPFTPFRILLWGRGTTEDRAWIFAGLLKQYTKTRVDAVILEPKSASLQADSSKFLIGVMIHSNPHKGKVYLYDPFLGIPLPANSSDTLPSILVDRPATLEEFTKDGTVFEMLRDRSNEYRLKPQELKKVTCQIVSDSSYASPRSKLLQKSFDKQQDVLVYEKLFDRTEKVDPRNRGLFDRVSHFSSAPWSSEDVSLWAYPEEIIRRLKNVAEKPTVNRKIDRIIEIFRAPHGSSIINELFRSRVAQLMGKHTEALKGYLQVRIVENIDGSGAGGIQKSDSSILNALAADDAAFWSCIVKIEQEKFNSAVVLLKAYERKQRTKAHSYGHCMFWLGYAQMKNNESAAGVQSLSRIPELVPAYRTGRYFISKWRAIRDSQ